MTLGSDDLINIPLPAKLIRCVLKDAPRHGATPREGDFGGRGRGGGAVAWRTPHVQMRMRVIHCGHVTAWKRTSDLKSLLRDDGGQKVKRCRNTCRAPFYCLR